MFCLFRQNQSRYSLNHTWLHQSTFHDWKRIRDPNNLTIKSLKDSVYIYCHHWINKAFGKTRLYSDSFENENTNQWECNTNERKKKTIFRIHFVVWSNISSHIPSGRRSSSKMDFFLKLTTNTLRPTVPFCRQRNYFGSAEWVENLNHFSLTTKFVSSESKNSFFISQRIRLLHFFLITCESFPESGT